MSGANSATVNADLLVEGNEIGRDELVAPEAARAAPEGEPAWWGKARELRAEGRQIIEIAMKVGHSASSVHHALNEKGDSLLVMRARNARRRADKL